MAKRTTPSLAVSEYVSPNLDSSVQVWRARLQLIEAAKRVFPFFLKKLSADVFPLYCQLAKAGKLSKGRNNFDKALWGKSPYDADPGARPGDERTRGRGSRRAAGDANDGESLPPRVKLRVWGRLDFGARGGA